MPIAIKFLVGGLLCSTHVSLNAGMMMPDMSPKVKPTMPDMSPPIKATTPGGQYTQSELYLHKMVQKLFEKINTLKQNVNAIAQNDESTNKNIESLFKGVKALTESNPRFGAPTEGAPEGFGPADFIYTPPPQGQPSMMGVGASVTAKTYKKHIDNEEDGWHYGGQKTPLIKGNSIIGTYNGNYGATNGQPVTKTVSVSDAQKYVTVAFDFIEADSYDDEKFEFKINGVLVLEQKFKYDVDESGRPHIKSKTGKPTEITGQKHWPDQVHRITFRFLNENGTLTLLKENGEKENVQLPFSNTLKIDAYSYQDEPTSNEFWGLSRVSVESAQSLPELLNPNAPLATPLSPLILEPVPLAPAPIPAPQVTTVVQGMMPMMVQAPVPQKTFITHVDNVVDGWTYNNAPTTLIKDSKYGPYSDEVGPYNGNFGATNGIPVQRIVPVSGLQDYVTVAFDFIEGDSFDDEQFDFALNDTPILSEKFKYDVDESGRPHIKSKTGKPKQLLGAGNYADQVHRITFRFKHENGQLILLDSQGQPTTKRLSVGNTLKLDAYSHQNEPTQNEFWGMSRFYVASAKTLSELLNPNAAPTIQKVSTQQPMGMMPAAMAPPVMAPPVMAPAAPIISAVNTPPPTGPGLIRHVENDSSGWTYNGQITPLQYNPIMGNYSGNFGATKGIPVKKRATITNVQKFVSVEFDFLEADSYDDEKFDFRINNVPVLDKKFSFQKDESDSPYVQSKTGAPYNFIGQGNFPDQVHRIKFKFKNENNILTLIDDAGNPQKTIIPFDGNIEINIHSDQNEGIDNEFWGVSNLSISSANSLKELASPDGYKIHAFDDFKGGNASGWTWNGRPARTAYVENAGYISGPHGHTGPEQGVARVITLKDMDPHTLLSMVFLEGDSFDNETFEIRINGKTVFRQNFQHETDESGNPNITSLSGKPRKLFGSGWNDQIHRIEIPLEKKDNTLIFTHPINKQTVSIPFDKEIKVEILSQQDGNVEDEFWGIKEFIFASGEDPKALIEKVHKKSRGATPLQKN